MQCCRHEEGMLRMFHEHLHLGSCGASLRCTCHAMTSGILSSQGVSRTGPDMPLYQSSIVPLTMQADLMPLISLNSRLDLIRTPSTVCMPASLSFLMSAWATPRLCAAAHLSTATPGEGGRIQTAQYATMTHRQLVDEVAIPGMDGTVVGRASLLLYCLHTATERRAAHSADTRRTTSMQLLCCGSRT